MATTYLVTGASSGIGLELVKQLSASDDNKVFATVRKRGSSATGVDEISKLVAANVTLIEGIDVSDDTVGDTLIPQLNGSVIDVVIHNAGSSSGSREANDFSDQKLDTVSMDRMRSCFEVNTLGPLRVQKALLAANLMKSVGGGTYAYRTSKAAVNMIAKCMSCDLKEKGITLMAIAPGFVATEFGPGYEKMKGWGGMDVDVCVRGLVSLISSMTMENSGEFRCIQRDGSAKVMKW
eukprot:scaffold3951_cov69-Cyclotella_meneghiniana.AAC.14